MASYDRERLKPTLTAQEASRRALFAFLERLHANDVAGVEALLALDAKTTADAGGEFRAPLRTVIGRDKVARFYLAIAKVGQGLTTHVMILNGLPAVVVDASVVPEGVASRTVIQAELDATGKIRRIYIVAARAKLSRVDAGLARAAARGATA